MPRKGVLQAVAGADAPEDGEDLGEYVRRLSGWQMAPKRRGAKQRGSRSGETGAQRARAASAHPRSEACCW